MNISKILKEIDKLSTLEKSKLLNQIKKKYTSFFIDTPSIFEEIQQERNKDGLCCVHCHSKEVVRFGKYHVKEGKKTVERQRFRCKSCKKTFSPTTATPLYRSKKTNLWFLYIECMIQGLSIRESAKRLEGISTTTLFYWRHKILSVIEQMNLDTFNEIVEIDETYFLYSEKGSRKIKGRKPRKRGGVANFRGISREQVCVLVARDRAKKTYVGVLGFGRIKKEQLDKAIGTKLKDTTVLCADGWRAFSTYAKKKNLEHYPFDTSNTRKKGIYHIQNVNNYHQRLKQWIQRFKGVATKYLQHYLAWFNLIDKFSIRLDEPSLRIFALESCKYPMMKTNISLSKTYLVA